MSETTYDNQAPIFRFLNKHKWRIILPLLFAAVFIAYPRYIRETVAVQQELFIKSSVLSQNDLINKTKLVKNQILTDEFLQSLLVKYDIYKTNADEQSLIERLRNSIEIGVGDWEVVEGTQVHIWINFRKENSSHIEEIASDIVAQFENNSDFQVNKFFTKPYESTRFRNWVFFADITARGLVMLAIPLILPWEIPNMFYSPKTKETVFNPLKSDWQNELTEAKLRKQTWKAFEINIRYSFAFLSAMVQKSPLGSLMEYVRKIAS